MLLRARHKLLVDANQITCRAFAYFLFFIKAPKEIKCCHPSSKGMHSTFIQLIIVFHNCNEKEHLKNRCSMSFFFLKQKAQHNSRGLTIIHFGANAIRVGSLESRAGIDNFEALHRILKVNPLI
jgi:hypothetical protein